LARELTLSRTEGLGSAKNLATPEESTEIAQLLAGIAENLGNMSTIVRVGTT